MINGHDENEVRKVVESILPDEKIRKACVEIFAASIQEANLYGRQKWATTVEGAKFLRLHVGHVIIITLENEKVWLALDKELLNSQVKPGAWLASKEVWIWDETKKNSYPEYQTIDSRNGYYLPGPDHEKIWPELRRLHFEALYKAARHWKQGVYVQTQNRHSPGVLKYLRNSLGIHVPDPFYD